MNGDPRCGVTSDELAGDLVTGELYTGSSEGNADIPLTFTFSSESTGSKIIKFY